MTIRVILDIPASPATREAVLACLKEALPATRAYAGCEALELLVNQDDPGNVVVYEQWTSRAHYDAYRAFRAESGFSAAFRALFAEPPIVRVLDTEHVYP